MDTGKWEVVRGVVRWSARVLSLLFLLLFATIYFGEGAPTSPSFLAATVPLAVLFVGLGLAWRWELPGGVVALAGIGWFYVREVVEAGKLPGGWVFPLLFVPPILFVLSGMARRSMAPLKTN